MFGTLNRWLIGLAFGLAHLGAAAQAFVPTDPEVVLERLPAAAGERSELKALRATLLREPERFDLASNLARRYIERGRREGDPRDFGRAEAIIAPWASLAAPSPEALILRATVAQNRHDFAAALADLDRAIHLDHRQAQAWLTRAAIQEVQGDYPAALQSCLALNRTAAGLAASVCLHSALSLSGQAAAAHDRLQALLPTMEGSGEERQWSEIVLGEIAERLGRVADAERHYRSALQGPRSIYLLTTYADFLLDQGRADAVRTLLRKETKADPLLLRLALAETALGDAAAAEHGRWLTERFEAARLRGDSRHLGDESRFRLHLLHDPLGALDLAERNWQSQREPRDARLVLEAAKAAGRREAAAPVIAFMNRSRLEDIRLQAYLPQPAGAPS